MRETPGDALEIGKNAVASFVVQAGKRGGKETIIDHEQTSVPFSRHFRARRV
jgi:hypothetical protein